MATTFDWQRLSCPKCKRVGIVLWKQPAASRQARVADDVAKIPDGFALDTAGAAIHFSCKKCEITATAAPLPGGATQGLAG